MGNIIELKKINKIYNTGISNQVLFDVDLNIEESSFVAIIGESGSGKSTLLNIIGTLDNPTTGKIIINNNEVSKTSKKNLSKIRNENLGFVFQFHYLLPEFTAIENILIPYKIKKKITKEEIKRAEELLEVVGLKDKKNYKINMLSGGQQQRVAIARSLMNNPKIILADEPTGALDSEGTENIYKLFREINEKFKTTIIVITHDKKVAEKADRIIEIKDGKIEMDIRKK